MRKRFLVSVGDVVAMQGNNIVFTSKTLTDSGITIETSNQEIRGGVGNQLQAIYYHTGTLNLNLTDTQFRLPYLALNTGSSIVNGGEIWSSETVILNGSTGTIQGVPAKIDGEDLAVWTEYEDADITLPVTFTNEKYTFSVDGTGIAPNSTICVKYLDVKNSAQTITIPADIVPDRIRLYIIANLYGDISGKGFIGKVQIEVPVAQLTGAQEISMTADGYSSTPLTAVALAYTDSSAIGCNVGSYYAKITEYLDNSKWSDGIIGLAIEGGDFSLKGIGTKSKLRVWATKGNTSFLCDNSLLTFTSGTEATATIGANSGEVTTVAAGNTLLSVKITEKPTIEASCTLTVEND